MRPTIPGIRDKVSQRFIYDCQVWHVFYKWQIKKAGQPFSGCPAFQDARRSRAYVSKRKKPEILFRTPGAFQAVTIHGQYSPSNGELQGNYFLLPFLSAYWWSGNISQESFDGGVDNDILESFRSTGKGWQTRMNDALREWLKEHNAR